MWKGPILLWTQCMYKGQDQYGQNACKRTNPIGTLRMYKGPILWVHVCIKYQPYVYMMHVEKTNPMGTRCMWKGPIQ